MTSPTPKPAAARKIAIVLSAIGIATVGTLLVIVPPAWKRTQRSEASLMEIEAQAFDTPKDGGLQVLLGTRYLLAGRNGEAAAVLSRAFYDGVNDPDVAKAQSAAAEAGATPTDLSSLATPFIGTYSGGSFLDGYADWQASRNPEGSGLATRQRWHEQRPDDVLALRLWGEALIREGRLAEAAVPLQRAASLAPGAVESHRDLGDLLNEAHLPNRAIDEYFQALGIRPSDTGALVGLGKVLLATGSTAVARKLFTRAIELDPKSVDAYLGRAYCTFSSTLFVGQTAADFAMVARLDPTRTSYLPRYADVLLRMGDARQAEALLRRRLARAPEDASAHYSLGTALLRNDPTPARLTEAEAQTREALRLAPGLPTAQVQLGDILLAQEKPADAYAALAQALKVAPNDYHALILFAQASRRTGHAAEAEQASARATAAYHDNLRINVLEDSEAKNQTDPAIHAELATLYARLGQAAKAQSETELLQLIKSDPAHAADKLNALDKQVDALLSAK